MIREIVTRSSFRRDVRRGIRRGLDLDRMWRIVDMLANDVPLPRSARRHRLSGNWAGCWECHIAGDWILIWSEDADAIYLERTGTHSDILGR